MEEDGGRDGIPRFLREQVQGEIEENDGESLSLSLSLSLSRLSCSRSLRAVFRVAHFPPRIMYVFGILLVESYVLFLTCRLRILLVESYVFFSYGVVLVFFW